MIKDDGTFRVWTDGRRSNVKSQNIDMLHRKAGTRELVEMHGSIERCLCPACAQQVGLQEVRRRLTAAPDGVPRCEDCAQALKPDVVLFGEYLHEPTMRRAQELCLQADLLLCIGSSLEVYPVAGLPRLTQQNGGAVAIITQGPTPLDAVANVVLKGDVVGELGALLIELGLPRHGEHFDSAG